MDTGIPPRAWDLLPGAPTLPRRGLTPPEDVQHELRLRRATARRLRRSSGHTTTPASQWKKPRTRTSAAPGSEKARYYAYIADRNALLTIAAANESATEQDLDEGEDTRTRVLTAQRDEARHNLASTSDRLDDTRDSRSRASYWSTAIPPCPTPRPRRRS